MFTDTVSHWSLLDAAASIDSSSPSHGGSFFTSAAATNVCFSRSISCCLWTSLACLKCRLGIHKTC